MKPNIVKLRTIGIGVIVVGMGLTYYFLLGPRLSLPANLTSQQQAAEAKKTSLDQQTTQLQTLKSSIPGTISTKNQLALRFPPDGQAVAFQQQVTAAAVGVGILNNNVASVTVGSYVADNGGDSGSMTFEITATGTYSQVASLMNKLYTLPRALSIDTVALAASGVGTTAPSQYTVRVDGHIYLFKPVADLPANLK